MFEKHTQRLASAESSMESFIAVETELVRDNIARQDARRTTDFTTFRHRTSRIKAKLLALEGESFDDTAVKQLQDELDTLEEIRSIAIEWMSECDAMNTSMLKRLQLHTPSNVPDGSPGHDHKTEGVNKWCLRYFLAGLFRNTH